MSQAPQSAQCADVRQCYDYDNGKSSRLLQKTASNGTERDSVQTRLGDGGEGQAANRGQFNSWYLVNHKSAIRMNGPSAQVL